MAMKAVSGWLVLALDIQRAITSRNVDRLRVSLNTAPYELIGAVRDEEGWLGPSLNPPFRGWLWEVLGPKAETPRLREIQIAMLDCFVDHGAPMDQLQGRSGSLGLMDRALVDQRKDLLRWGLRHHLTASPFFVTRWVDRLAETGGHPMPAELAMCVRSDESAEAMGGVDAIIACASMLHGESVDTLNTLASMARRAWPADLLVQALVTVFKHTPKPQAQRFVAPSDEALSWLVRQGVTAAHVDGRKNREMHMPSFMLEAMRMPLCRVENDLLEHSVNTVSGGGGIRRI
jgi:hypothetical protein